MTRYTPADYRPATRYGRDEPPQQYSVTYRLGIVRDGIVGFVAVFIVLLALLIAAGGTT
jgi:hypothetical protein